MSQSEQAQKRIKQCGNQRNHIKLLFKYGTVTEKNGVYEYYIPKKLLNKIRLELRDKIQDLGKISGTRNSDLNEEDSIITT